MTQLSPAPAPARFVYPREEFEGVMVMLLSAMARYPGVCEAVRKVGPDLFPAGAPRVLAAILVTSDEPDQSSLPTRERARLHRLAERVARERLPDSEEWGLALLRRHAERQYQSLLASTLDWSAERVREGKSVSWVRRTVVHAFDVAEGNIPLDPVDPWRATS